MKLSHMSLYRLSEVQRDLTSAVPDLDGSIWTANLLDIGYRIGNISQINDLQLIRKAAEIRQEKCPYFCQCWFHMKMHVVTSSASAGNWGGQIYFGQMTPTGDLGLTWSYTPSRAGADRNYNRLKEETHSCPSSSTGCN